MTAQPTPQLVIEAKFRDRSRIEELLDQGIDIDALDDKGRTALMWAAAWGRSEIVELLLERGAQTDMRDQYGETALIKAARRGRTDVVEILLDLGGADPRACDNYGRTALEKALQWGKTNVAGLFDSSLVDSVQRETLGVTGPELFETDSVPLTETDLFKAIEDAVEPEEEFEEDLLDDEEGLNDTIEVLGLSLFGESTVPPETGVGHEEKDPELESLKVQEETIATAGPAPQSPSEDELMALFDSYDEQDEDTEQDEPVEVQDDFEHLFDSGESVLDSGEPGPEEAEDLLTLDDDFVESELKKPTR